MSDWSSDGSDFGSASFADDEAYVDLEEALPLLQPGERPVKIRVVLRERGDLPKLAAALKANVTALHVGTWGEMCLVPEDFFLDRKQLQALVNGMARCRSGLTSFKLSSTQLLQGAAALLPQLLGGAVALADLQLKAMHLKPREVEVAVGAVGESAALTSLDLSENHVGFEGIRGVVQLLRTAPIRTLRLHECGLDLRALRLLTSALAGNATVQELYLGSSRLGDQGAELFGGMLRQNNVIEKLFLRFGEISGAGFVALVSALSHNTSLQCLDLAANQLLRLTTPFAFNQTLVDLDLGNCHLADGGVLVAQALSVNPGMKRLKLNNNDLTPRAMQELGHALQRNTTLESLALSGNDVGPAGACALAEALAQNSTLTCLKMTWSEILPEGIRHLQQGLSHNASLKSLGLCKNRLDHEGALVVAELLNTNDGLTKLDISMNDLTIDGMRHILEALEDNVRMKSLKFRDDRTLEETALHLHFQERAKALLERNKQPALVLSLKATLQEEQLEVTCSTLGGSSFNLRLPSDSGPRELRAAAVAHEGLGPLAQGRPLHFVLPDASRLKRQYLAAALCLPVVLPPELPVVLAPLPALPGSSVRTSLSLSAPLLSRLPAAAEVRETPRAKAKAALKRPAAVLRRPAAAAKAVQKRPAARPTGERATNRRR